MDAPRTDDVKARIRICYGCEERMTKTANAMRRHGAAMLAAIELARTDLTEEQRLEAGVRLRESWKEAQSEWDDYCEHLRSHGLI